MQKPKNGLYILSNRPFRPACLRDHEPTTKKAQIEQLQDWELEWGEEKISQLYSIKCEHNLPGVPNELLGCLIITNFKIVFKPLEAQLSQDEIRILTFPHVQAFFSIPMGQLYTVEVKTQLTNKNSVKHTAVEIVTKDCRQISFILSNFEHCEKAKSIIRSYAFLDSQTEN